MNYRNERFAILLSGILCLSTLTNAAYSQSQVSAEDKAKLENAKAKSNEDAEKKGAAWAASLNLNDAQKEARVAGLITTHLERIRDWHNEHPFTTVPEGINPVTGTPLSKLHRQMIANSAQPKSYHTDLIDGLKKALTDEQVNAVLDKYTVGKVAFTMNGYRSIVPDLTPQEATTIEGYLKQARAEAIDYKNMDQISAVFEIYKTKSEQYLNSNGRSWKQMYKAYTDVIKAKKAAAAQGQTKPAQ